MEAMTFPGNHRINEYVIPYRNAISVNAGFEQCSYDALSSGLRFAHSGLSRRNEKKTELYCAVPLALVLDLSLHLRTD